MEGFSWECKLRNSGMSVINSFEDIQGWQKARELNKEIYSITNKSSFNKDYGLRDQIRRAGISVMSNIAEGFERNGSKEFIYFLSISKGSCGEIRAQLYIAKDLNYISEEEFEHMFKLTVETSKLISGLISYLKKSELKGAKFN